MPQHPTSPLPEPWRPTVRLLRGHVVAGPPPATLVATAAEQLESYGLVATAADKLLDVLATSQKPTMAIAALQRAIRKAQEAG